MTARRWVFILSIAALVVLEAAIVWRPFDVRTAIYKTPWRSNKPVGELVAGFEATQRVPAGLVRIRPSDKKSVHWHGLHSLRTSIRPNCFAIRFATYKRANAGEFETTWRQGNAAQSWRIAAANLADNEFVDFCPRGGIDTNRASLIGIRGIDSHAGQAATAWLIRSKLEPVSIQGKATGDRSLALQLVYLHRVLPHGITAVGHGAFLLGCICSLGIGLLALLAVRRDLIPGNAPRHPVDA